MKLAPKPSSILLSLLILVGVVAGVFLMGSSVDIGSMGGLNKASQTSTQDDSTPTTESAQERALAFERRGLQLQSNAGSSDAPTDQLSQVNSVQSEVPRQLSEADQQQLDEIRIRIAREDAERAERMRLAARSPIGESIYSVEEMIRGQARQASAAAPSAAIQGSASVVQAEPVGLGVPTYTLRRGSIIPATLMGEIRSELPGLVRAMVTLDVYDSVTGHQILIPRGSQLVGRYDNQTSAGQERLFIYWDEVQLPDGGSVDLNNASSVDARGSSGVTGKRNGNFVTALVGATLLNLAQNAGRPQATSDASDLAAAARIATGQAGASITEQYLGQRLSQGTRFAIAPGTVVNVVLEEDYKLPSQGRF